MESKIEGRKAYYCLILGGFMVWRSKLVLLLIIYFGGFATAIYNLSPASSEAYQAGSYNSSNDGSRNDSNVVLFERFCDKCDKIYAKASAGFSGMNMKEFKDAINRGIQKLKGMTPKSQNTAEGAEDK